MAMPVRVTGAAPEPPPQPAARRARSASGARTAQATRSTTMGDAMRITLGLATWWTVEPERPLFSSRPVRSTSGGEGGVGRCGSPSAHRGGDTDLRCSPRLWGIAGHGDALDPASIRADIAQESRNPDNPVSCRGQDGAGRRTFSVVAAGEQPRAGRAVALQPAVSLLVPRSVAFRLVPARSDPWCRVGAHAGHRKSGGSACGRLTASHL
jgi:hypothetical protein